MHGTPKASTGSDAEGGITVEIATTFAEIEALRSVWTGLEAANIDSEIDFFSTVTANAENVVSPFVVHIRNPYRTQRDLLVAARLEKMPVQFRLGYSSAGSLMVRAIAVAFDGVIGARGEDDEALVLRTLKGFLDAGEADVLLLRNVDPSSTLYKVARSQVSGLRWAHCQAVDRLWVARLAPSLDAFLANRSAKSRNTYRRKERKLREQFGEALSLQCLRDHSDFEKICRDMHAIATRTYQAGLGAAFSNSPMERALIAQGLARGTFRCWILYIHDRPVAFWAGMGHQGVFYITTPGFDPEFGQLSVGSFTMLRMIEELCADPDYSWIEFGRGDAQYKIEFAEPMKQQTDIWVAAARPWPVLVTAAISLTGLTNQTAKRWMENHEWGRRLKSRWRHRFQGTPQKART